MDVTLHTSISWVHSLQILKLWTWVHTNIKQFSINLSKLQWSIESDKLIFIFSACRCVCVLVVPFLGFYTILFYTLFESLYSQNYCCCASDKVIWGRTIEREQRKGAKSILCSSAIKRKHNSIVRIFIEQASIRKVHLIKLCTFKLHTLALAHSHSQRWISNNDSDNEQWIYEICIRDIDGMYNVHTHFAWNLFQLCRVKQFLLVCSSVHSMPCCPHLMMFINLLVGSCCTSDCLLRSIVRHLFCQSVTHAHTHAQCNLSESFDATKLRRKENDTSNIFERL